MKITIGQKFIEQAKADARRALNYRIRRGRLEIMLEVPIPKRKMFQREYRKRRNKVFKTFGYDQGDKHITRLEGRAFLDTLTADQRVALQKAMSEEIKKLAVKANLPSIVELEDLRQVQLEGVQKTKTIEDVMTISQVTRDVARGIMVKYKVRFNETP